MPALADLFFGVQVVYFLLFMVFGVMFFGCEGLDMQVCWILEGWVASIASSIYQ